jgi:hypothetical protein
VIGKALEFKKETEFMQDLGIEAAERYNIQFEDQDFLDFAVVVDLNRPIIVDGGHLSSNATEMIVLVSGYKILRNSKGLTFLAKDIAARKALVGEVRRVCVLVSWLKRCARPDIAEWIDESLFGCKIQRIRGANVCTGDTSMRPSFPCHGRNLSQGLAVSAAGLFHIGMCPMGLDSTMAPARSRRRTRCSECQSGVCVHDPTPTAVSLVVADFCRTYGTYYRTTLG